MDISSSIIFISECKIIWTFEIMILISNCNDFVVAYMNDSYLWIMIIFMILECFFWREDSLIIRVIWTFSYLLNWYDMNNKFDWFSIDRESDELKKLKYWNEREKFFVSMIINDSREKSNFYILNFNLSCFQLYLEIEMKLFIKINKKISILIKSKFWNSNEIIYILIKTFFQIINKFIFFLNKNWI